MIAYTGHLRPAMWSDHGIILPLQAAGEVRTTCLQCSASRRKSRDAYLAVNVEKGTWVCHHFILYVQLLSSHNPYRACATLTT
jgi:hypothetical protein